MSEGEGAYEAERAELNEVPMRSSDLTEVNPEALVRIATELSEENKRLARALKPFADKGAELIRKRGPAIDLKGAHPVRIGDLVRADGAMRDA